MRQPVLSSLKSVVTSILAAVVVAVPVLWAFDLPGRAGILVYPQQMLVLVLGASLGLAFLDWRRDGTRSGTCSRGDPVLCAVALALTVCIAVRYPALAVAMYVDRTEAALLGAPLIVLVFMAVRRTAGLFMVVLMAAFALFAAVGFVFPGLLEAPRQAPSMQIVYLVYEAEGLLGRAIEIVATTVVIFIVFGRVFAAAGAGEVVTDAARAAVGLGRGGPAKVAILSSGLLGSVTGSVVSNVMATGALTIPLMKRIGYPAAVAGGIEAIASTGSQLMPPVMGAAAFLIPEFIAVSYAEVILAATVPAILFYAMLLFQADSTAARLGIDAATDGAPRLPFPRGRAVLFLLPLAVVVAAILAWRQTPEAAGIVGTIAALVLGLLLGYRDKRIRPGAVWRLLIDAGIACAPIVMIGAAAGFIIGAVGLTGFSVTMSLWLGGLGADNLLLLLVLAALTAIILGLGLPTVAIYVLGATVLAPSLIAAGVEPLAAHLFVFYGGILCMITPPVAFASLAGATVAEASFWSTCMAAMRFGWPVFVLPFLFVLTPGLLLQGTPADVCLAVVSTAIGLWGVEVGFSGYWRGTLRGAVRSVLVVCGLVLLYPKTYSLATLSVDLAAALAGTAVLFLVFRRRALSRPAIATRQSAGGGQA